MRLRYWIKSSLDIAVGILGGALMYTLIMAWQIDDFGVRECLRAAALFAVGFGGFMALLMNIAVYNNALPVCLSFGSTRKEAMVGLQLFRLIPAAFCSIFAAVVFAFVKGNIEVPPVMVFCFSMALFLILGAWGSVAGMLQAKFGNKAGAAAVLVEMGIIILITVAVVIAALNSTEEQFMGVLFSPVLYGGLLLVGIVTHGLCLIPECKVINQYSVKL